VRGAGLAGRWGARDEGGGPRRQSPFATAAAGATSFRCRRCAQQARKRGPRLKRSMRPHAP
jgi:hypothetical protein